MGYGPAALAKADAKIEIEIRGRCYCGGRGAETDLQARQIASAIPH